MNFVYCSIVDEDRYQFVTSCVRATTLVGNFIGSLLSQLLVSLAHLDYFYLNVISLVNVSIAFVISCFLPMPRTSLFFFASTDSPEKLPADEAKPLANEGVENQKLNDPPASSSRDLPSQDNSLVKNFYWYRFE